MTTKTLWVVSLALAVLFTSCTATEDDDTTNTFVRVVTMTSEQGQFGGNVEAGTDLFSDVCSTDPSATGTPQCFVFNDNGVVTLSAQPKDLTRPFSDVNDIIFSTYRVTYIRSDGQNVPGVDVPFPFDGASNFRVPADGTSVTRGFMVVRQQAKLESPLRELVGGGDSGLISTLARIDFFGVDLAGRSITVSATLNISFGDF